MVLGIARSLAAEIEAQPGMRPVLVRDGDYYLPHRERMGRAHQAEADLFVSIHADAFRNARAKGATVYVLSERGATDEAALRLAERENASDLIGGVSLADKDQLLARVLLDLSQSAAISASSSAGDRVIKRLRSVTEIRKSRVQQAPFLVLKSPDIPSLLIETAYISNPKEEAALKTPGYQRSLARAIHDGIVDYFRDNPPPDSYLALNPPPERSAPTRHMISSGETLSEIAQHYKISLFRPEAFQFHRRRRHPHRPGPDHTRRANRSELARWALILALALRDAPAKTSAQRASILTAAETYR